MPGHSRVQRGDQRGTALLVVLIILLVMTAVMLINGDILNHLTLFLGNVETSHETRLAQGRKVKLPPHLPPKTRPE